MKAADIARQNDADLRGWLSSTQGRRLYLRQLTQAGLWSSSYAEKATATAYNEGRRSVALDLLREAQRVCPELHAQALREQIDQAIAAKVEPPAADE